MNFRRTTRAAVLLLLVIWFPEHTTAQKVGTSSLQFLKVMPTARATALGDAYSTLASGANAVFWNPAGLTVNPAHEFSTTLTFWIFETRQSALAYSLPLGSSGVLGLQFQYADFGELEETRTDHLMFVGSGSDLHFNPGLTGNTFSPSAYVVGVSYARQFTDKFSAGASVKFASESLWREGSVQVANPTSGAMETYDTFARVFLFDFGMHYNTGYRTVRIGIAVQNFGSQVKFAKEGSPAPLAFRFGTAADLVGTNALLTDDENMRLTFAYDILQPNDYDQQMHYGLEFSFRDFVALRAGYKFNYDHDRLTWGGGVRTDFSGMHLNFDYSYSGLGQYLGAAHRLTLGVQF